MNKSIENNEYVCGSSDWKRVAGTSIRTKGCILIHCTEGCAVVSVEFKLRAIRKGDIILVFPDTMFFVNKVSSLFAVRYIELLPKLFDETTVTLSSRFLSVIYGAPVFTIRTEYRELWEAWQKQLSRIIQHKEIKPACLMLRNLMQNFFIELEHIVMSENIGHQAQSIKTSRQLFYRFCQSLAENCYSRHEVKFYADKLCITPYYLAKVTKSASGMSPKEFIDRQIIMEIKRFLTTTELSIKEIAIHFHFETMSYMARYFRRHTGMNPNEFRKS